MRRISILHVAGGVLRQAVQQQIGRLGVRLRPLRALRASDPSIIRTDSRAVLQRVTRVRVRLRKGVRENP